MLKEAVNCFTSRPTHIICIFFNLDSILQGTRLLSPSKFWKLSLLWISWETEASNYSVILTQNMARAVRHEWFFCASSVNSYCDFPRSLAFSCPCLSRSFLSKWFSSCWNCSLLLWQQGPRLFSAVYWNTSTHTDTALESVLRWQKAGSKDLHVVLQRHIRHCI